MGGKKWKEVVWQIFNNSKIDHPNNVRLYLQSHHFLSLAGNQVVLNENKNALEG